MNACLRTQTQKPGRGENHTKRRQLWCRHLLNSSHEKKREGKRDLKSVARRKINCVAEHKRKNKVSSLLSSAANVTLVSALNKFEIKRVN